MGLITDTATTVLEGFGTFSQQVLHLEPALAAPLVSIIIAALITGYISDWKNLREAVQFDAYDAVLGIVVLGSLVSVYYTFDDPARLLIDNWTLAILFPVITVMVQKWTGIETK